VNPAPSAVYTGISNAIVTISRAEGLRTLWRGLSSVVVGAGQSPQHSGSAMAATDAFAQALHTQSTLHPTKLSSTPWVATMVANMSTILLLLVRRLLLFTDLIANAK
jgi:hypothetical protein